MYCPVDCWSGYTGLYTDWRSAALVYPQQARTLLRNNKRTSSRTQARAPTTIPAIAPPGRDVSPLLSLAVGSHVGEGDEVAVVNVVDAAVIVPASVEAGKVRESVPIFSKRKAFRIGSCLVRTRMCLKLTGRDSSQGTIEVQSIPVRNAIVHSPCRHTIALRFKNLECFT